jgi:hypothetical protein
MFFHANDLHDPVLMSDLIWSPCFVHDYARGFTVRIAFHVLFFCVTLQPGSRSIFALLPYLTLLILISPGLRSHQLMSIQFLHIPHFHSLDRICMCLSYFCNHFFRF